MTEQWPGNDGEGPDARADRRRGRFAVVLGSALGMVLVGIITIPRLGATPLWRDEAYSLGVANQFAIGVTQTGATMIGYYAPLWVWARVSESTVWLRSLSLVFAMATMPVVAALGRRIGGIRLALIAPALLAGSFLFQVMATELRAYALETLILTVSYYALIRAVQAGTDTDGARRWWIVLTLVAPWGVFAHGLFPIHLGAMALAVLLSPKPLRALVRILPMLAASAVLLALLFWLGISAVGDWVPATRPAYVKYTIFRFLGLHHVLQVVVGAAIAVSAGAAVVARPRARTKELATRTRAWLRIVPVIWATVPIILLLLVSVVRPEFVDRYLSAITPGIALATGAGLLASVDWASRRLRFGSRVAWVSFGTAGVVLVVALAMVNRNELVRQPHAHWDRIASLISDRAQPGDGILLYSDRSRPGFERAWGHQGHGAVPEVLNMPRQLGQVKRVDAHYPLDAASRRRMLAHRRIWTITVGSAERAAHYYVALPPLTTRYRQEQMWHFPGLSGPVTVRLYERTNP